MRQLKLFISGLGTKRLSELKGCYMTDIKLTCAKDISRAIELACDSDTVPIEDLILDEEESIWCHDEPDAWSE